MTVSVEELARFVAAPPPRALPPAIAAARLPRAPWLVACIVTTLVLAASLPVTFVIFPDRLLDDLGLDVRQTAFAAGAVTAVAPTGQTLVVRDGDVDVDRPILRIAFHFTTLTGASVDGASHTAATSPAIGAEVDVEYLPGSPTAARIVGTTCSSTPRIAAFLAAIPVLAMLWFARVVRQRRTVRRILTEGRFALADVTELQEIRTSFGPGRLRAVLRAADGPGLPVEFDQNRREAALIRDRAAHGRAIGVLALADDPQRLLFVDTLLREPSRLDATARIDDPADDADDETDDDDAPPGRTVP